MKSLLYFFLLTSFSISAQIKGVIVDETHKPIPYVNIWVENENTGTTSEENGTFVIDISDNDKVLIFSCIGFETKKIKASEAEKIVMKSIVFQLDEVVISKPIQSKEIEVGVSQKRFYLPEPQQTPWIFVRRFYLDQNKKELKYVKSITFYTQSEVEEGIFRARIFKVNQDGSPKEDIVAEEIIVKVKKGRHKTVLDISSYALEIPKEGIMVGFESLLTENNKYQQSAGIINSKKTIKTLNYSPHILYTYINAEESYAYRAGNWTKQLFRMFAQPREENRVIAPAINLTLTN